jgi:hypothetical protein
LLCLRFAPPRPPLSKSSEHGYCYVGCTWHMCFMQAYGNTKQLQSISVVVTLISLLPCKWWQM